MREHADDLVADAQAKYDADLAKLPPDAPLWDWAPFLDTRNSTKQSELLAHIRTLDRRQSDAELMLERGDFPLGYLGWLDLTPTPRSATRRVLCCAGTSSHSCSRRRESKPLRRDCRPVSDALAAMKWLVGYECSCDAELLAWETMAKTYDKPNYDVYELAELRDPKNFGRIVRRYPERFSMLTPRAHLKAWLAFADKKISRPGAGRRAQARPPHRRRGRDAQRQIRHRRAVAGVEIYAVLDLEMTPRLCGAALTQVHGDFAKVLQPKPDDPRRYSELLDRLGAYEPLTALVWLAGHGCDAEGELSEAEAVIRTYQDLPARAAMLATLAQAAPQKLAPRDKKPAAQRLRGRLDSERCVQLPSMVWITLDIGRALSSPPPISLSTTPCIPSAARPGSCRPPAPPCSRRP